MVKFIDVKEVEIIQSRVDATKIKGELDKIQILTLEDNAHLVSKPD